MLSLQNAKKDFLKLDRTDQCRIDEFINKLQNHGGPSSTRKDLKGSLSGLLWSYRASDLQTNM